MRLDHVTLSRVIDLSNIVVRIKNYKLHTSLSDDNSNLEPPDPISNSEVKRVNANGSAGSPCVRVGNRQTFFFKAFSLSGSLFFYLKYNVFMIIGLTGGIGSGKSAAASFFMDLGINVLDADDVSRDALEINSPGYELFINAFGSSYLDKNNLIDRAKLRSTIFSNKDKKLQLENIIHPIVKESILDFIKKSQSPYTIIMVPLIFETNTAKNYSRILIIDCDIDTQISRTIHRDAQNTSEVMNIINKQASREERLSIADDIILNSSSLDSLREQVLTLHNKYMEIINNG